MVKNFWHFLKRSHDNQELRDQDLTETDTDEEPEEKDKEQKRTSTVTPEVRK